MNAKFFGNSLFGGEFFVKDFPLSDENPDSNILKLSFQGIGNNLVITGRTSDGRTLTIFGVADTTSVTFDVTNENGTYTEENNNLTWEWENNLLKISVSTYGFIKAVIYNPDGKEVVFPIKTEEDKIYLVFPVSLKDEEKYTIKLLYSYNGLDVASSLGDASLRNIGKSSGNVPVIELNGTLNWKIIPFVSNVYEIQNPELHQFIDYNNGNFQRLTIDKNIDLQFTAQSGFRNGDKIILQIVNNGSSIFVNGIEIDKFYGTYNLTIVKVNNVLQYWGKQEVREIR